MKTVIVILLMTFAAAAASHAATAADASAPRGGGDGAGDCTIAWRQMIPSAELPTAVMTIDSTEVAIRPLPKAKPKDPASAALFVGEAIKSKTPIYPGKTYAFTLVGKDGKTQLYVNGYPDGPAIATRLGAHIKSAPGVTVDRLAAAMAGDDILRMFAEQIEPRDIKTVAHRGINKYAPENTRISYVQAVAAHAPIVEMDTALSKDGVIVLMHDPTVNRTTNGKGKVADLTADELAKLDAGSWKDKKYAGEPVPRLTDIADVCRGKTIMMLDLKAEGQGKAVAEWLDKGGFARDQVILAPWTDAEGAALRQYVKDIPMIRLTTKVPTDTIDDAYFAKMKQTGFSAFSVSWPYLTKEFVDAAHKNGMKIYVWTVNDNPEIAGSALLGVDGVITDDAAATSKTLADLARK